MSGLYLPRVCVFENGRKRVQNPFTIVQQLVQVQEYSYTLVPYGVRVIIPFSVRLEVSYYVHLSFSASHLLPAFVNLLNSYFMQTILN